MLTVLPLSFRTAISILGDNLDTAIIKHLSEKELAKMSQINVENYSQEDDLSRNQFRMTNGEHNEAFKHSNM